MEGNLIPKSPGIENKRVQGEWKTIIWQTTCYELIKSDKLISRIGWLRELNSSYEVNFGTNQYAKLKKS